MNAYLIATQGISGGSLSMALQGFSSTDDVVVVPYVPSVGGIGRYYSPSRQAFDIPVTGGDEEELIAAMILQEVAKYVC